MGLPLSRRWLLTLIVAGIIGVSLVTAAVLNWFTYEKEFEVTPNVVANIVLSDETPVINTIVHVDIEMYVEGANWAYIWWQVTCYWYNETSGKWEQQWYAADNLDGTPETNVTTTPTIVYGRDFTVDKLGTWKIVVDITLHQYG